MPPYNKVRWTSATILPIYLKDLGDVPSWGNLHFSTNVAVGASQCLAFPSLTE
uniref:F16P2 n=1 Tax=Arundo donax TaxID=35708 RepID=A0A0A9E0H6_ARUDO